VDKLINKIIMEEKTHVYLPVSLAKKVKELENSDNFVLEYIERSKKSMMANLDSMDEEVLMYKANMVKARKEFGAAVEEMLAADYKVWEKFDEDRKSTYGMAKQMVESLQPLKAELESIKKLMDSINTWRANDLLELLQAINSNAVNGETRNMMKFLMENYKQEK